MSRKGAGTGASRSQNAVRIPVDVGDRSCHCCLTQGGGRRRVHGKCIMVIEMHSGTNLTVTETSGKLAAADGGVKTRRGPVVDSAVAHCVGRSSWLTRWHRPAEHGGSCACSRCPSSRPRNSARRRRISLGMYIERTRKEIRDALRRTWTLRDFGFIGPSLLFLYSTALRG